MAGEDLIELKFRLFDGSDIGPDKYDPETTIASLKEIVVSRWPQGKEIAPRTMNDVKLINAGRILENNQTLEASRIPVVDLQCGIITMHVVVRPPNSHKTQDKKKRNESKETRCGCTIL